MKKKCLYVFTLIMMVALIPVSASAQGRKLGPDTAKSIGKSYVDPTFTSTKLDCVALLPLVNTAKNNDAASILSKNFISQLTQLHPEYKFVTPEEIVNTISASGLDDEYNIFLGDYAKTGTANLRLDFYKALRDKNQIDAVLVGKITHWGEGYEIIHSLLGGDQQRKAYVVGMEMKLFRTTDGRLIWSGSDSINTRKQEQMQEAAQVLCEIFARFLGRQAY